MITTIGYDYEKIKKIVLPNGNIAITSRDPFKERKNILWQYEQ